MVHYSFMYHEMWGNQCGFPSNLNIGNFWKNFSSDKNFSVMNQGEENLTMLLNLNTGYATGQSYLHFSTAILLWLQRIPEQMRFGKGRWFDNCGKMTLILRIYFDDTRLNAADEKLTNTYRIGLFNYCYTIAFVL